MTGFTPQWSPRPRWAQAPAFVRDWAESVLGAPVVTARDVTGGFSSGVASRLTAANGARLFVKAVKAELNPFSPRMVRRELRIGPALAATAATAPKLRGGLDTDGWVAAAFDDIDGATPPWPWTEADADRTLAALAQLHHVLTPAPGIPVPPAEHSLRGEIAAWTRLAAVADTELFRPATDDRADAAPTDREPVDPRPIEPRLIESRLIEQASIEPSPIEPPPIEPSPIEPWLIENRGLLAARSRGIDVSGDTVVNLDVRADNVVIDADGRVWFVDWPWACRGSAVLDVVVLLINFGVAGLDPERWLRRSHVAGVDDPLVTDLLCVLTGMWVEGCRRPEPPGTKGMRAFQRAHLTAATDWLRRRINAGL